MTPPPPERMLLPFEAGPHRMQMGLVACPPDELVEIDARYVAEMAERRALLRGRHAEVVAWVPGTAAARAEVLATLLELLPRRHPDWFAVAGGAVENRLTGERWAVAEAEPLELAGRLVQEDLCLIDVRGPAPVLAAAVLCAPSRWRLGEKIGRPLAAVHDTVPLYADTLSRPVDRFMGALRPGRVAERLNWSVVDDGALFQLGGKFRTAVDAAVTAANAPDTLWVRVERQTFRLMEGSGAVLFAIRVHSYPLRRVLAVPGAAARLAAAVRALPEAMAVYKSLPTIRGALLGCLDAVGAGSLECRAAREASSPGLAGGGAG